MPKLSIIVYAKDNQDICEQTISGLSNYEDQDFEIIVADASDDKAPLSKLIDTLDDPRAQLLASSSVKEQSRSGFISSAIQQSQGQWVSFINADDFIDPYLSELLGKIELNSPQVECLGWNKIDYDTPQYRNNYRSVRIPMDYGVHSVNGNEIAENFLSFKREGLVPFSLYHGAIKRELLDRIYQKYNNQYFELPVFEYEIGIKAVLEATELAFCQRPVSVIGAASEYNYLLVEDASIRDQLSRQVFDDIDHNNLPVIDDVPFDPQMSPKLSQSLALVWFMKTYQPNVDTSGWETNFIKRRVEDCNAILSSEFFDETKKAYLGAISAWQNGKYTKYFNPKFGEKAQNEQNLVGYFGEYLFLDKAVSNCQTTQDFYQVANHIMTPLSGLGIKFKDAA